MTRFVAPPGACDCHAHVISADTQRYRLVPERSYTPPPAPEAQYLDMLDALGMTFGVLVQISVYGTDNRLLREVLTRHPQRLRGVAVVKGDISDPELDALHEAGVRGVRINLSFGGGVAMAELDALAPKLAERGWHVQVLFHLRQLDEHLPRLRRLPVPCVIDHMGHFPAELGPQTPAFRQLLAIARDHPWWVKLSGAYRLEPAAPWPHSAELARALAEHLPDRLVWGSDWPHVAVAHRPDTQGLLDVLPLWLPEPDLRQRVLVDNPARLYGFNPLAT